MRKKGNKSARIESSITYWTLRSSRVFDRAEDSRSPTDGLAEEMERNPDSRAFSITRKMGLASRNHKTFRASAQVLDWIQGKFPDFFSRARVAKVSRGLHYGSCTVSKQSVAKKNIAR